MQRIVENIADGQRGALATIEDEKPDVRPFQFQFLHEGNFYFCTSNNKNVFNQIRKSPYAAFTTTNENKVTVRISGKVVFVNDLQLKEKVINQQINIKNIYESADNPIFELFCIEPTEASITEFGKNPLKINIKNA